MKISFTGHRWVTYDSIKSHLVSLRGQYPDAEWIVGGAIGADSAAARFAIDNGIPFHLVLPFPPDVMTKFWSAAQRAFLHKSIDCAASLSIVAPSYSTHVYQLRNERMVDMADLTVAYYTGQRGGTANCVRYAESVGRTLIIVNPGSKQ
ncbi:MAG: DNA-processing protein DprA [Candidatus Methanoperedenaceae archaeon]|nr:DNA-processing protein DprA [Candidatus Methanoperedenaceae archaeon]